MSNLERYQQSGGLSRLSRQTSSAIARVQAGSSVRQAQVEAAAELQAVKADAVAYVGRRALQNVALLSQVESQLAVAVPHASGRLAAIADLTAIALSDVVAETAHSVRRA